MPDFDSTTADAMPIGTVVRSPVLRGLLFGLGGVMIVIGVIGIFIPGLPTTVFLLAAAWSFSKSSVRLQRWLWLHPNLGPPIRDWYRYRVIPPRAKTLAVLMMLASVVYVSFAIPHPLAWPALAAVLIPVGIYVVTRASHPPACAAPDSGQTSTAE